jgi:hypothetical protein
MAAASSGARMPLTLRESVRCEEEQEHRNHADMRLPVKIGFCRSLLFRPPIVQREIRHVGTR